MAGGARGAVAVPMGGDPAVVEAGAATLEGLNASYTTAGEDVRRAGSQMAASWLGAAASAAQTSIGQLGSATATPAGVVTEAGRALRTYAQALREAQQMMATAEAMAAQATTTLQQQATAAPSMQRDVAMGRAQADAGAAEAMKAQAVLKEQQANQAAATAIDGLTARIDGMSIQAPNPNSPATYVLAGTPGARSVFTPQTDPGEFSEFHTAPAPPPPPPSDDDDGGWSLSDIGHTILDVGGLVPIVGEPLDLINAGWYAADGDWLSAGLSAGAAVPVAGWFFTGGKVATKGVKFVRGVDGAKSWLKARPSMVPASAERLPFTSDPTRIRLGEKWRWTDPESGKTVNYHAHERDPLVSRDYNAGRGPIYRTRVGGHYLDGAGKPVPKGQVNPKSHLFDDDAANSTHVPFPRGEPPPGVDSTRFAAPNPLSLADGPGNDG